jgi:hypothetical protein
MDGSGRIPHLGIVGGQTWPSRADKKNSWLQNEGQIQPKPFAALEKRQKLVANFGLAMPSIRAQFSPLRHRDFVLDWQRLNIIALNSGLPGPAAVWAIEHGHVYRWNHPFPGIGVLAGEQAAKKVTVEMGALDQIAGKHVWCPP